METIRSIEQFEEQIAKDQPTVMKFYTTWCPDCKNLDRFIGDVVDEQVDYHMTLPQSVVLYFAPNQQNL